MENYYGIQHHKANQNKANQNMIDDSIILLTACDDSTISQLDNKTLITYFCNDLKNILKIGDIRNIIHKLNQLDHTLIHLKEEEINLETPNLDDFFRTLSPVLLRSIEESLDSMSMNLNTNEKRNGEESLLKGWLESIRISIEEEIHIWQEKIL